MHTAYANNFTKVAHYGEDVSKRIEEMIAFSNLMGEGYAHLPQEFHKGVLEVRYDLFLVIKCNKTEQKPMVEVLMLEMKREVHMLLLRFQGWGVRNNLR